jgi:hypothetical protein
MFGFRERDVKVNDRMWILPMGIEENEYRLVSSLKPSLKQPWIQP